ncbi:MAG: RluA family pseudouridine synthase [Desulfovibrionaceae bacterium]|nr:RluA family pseudouridine synthase [Desulfovibrionaceae bacterium]
MPEYIITQQEAGQKYTAFIQRKCGIPLSHIHKLIRKGTLRINGKRTQPFTRLKEGDRIFLPYSLCTSLDTSSSVHSIKDESLSSVILQERVSIPHEDTLFLESHTYYEDNDILVINKPAGIPVHNGTRHRRSIASIVQNVYAEASFAPTLVHRLDKDTTGLLLIAKSYTMLNRLHTAWREHNVHKYYLAWVQGIWNESKSMYIENSIAKSEEKMIVTEGNDVAITVRCLQRARNSSLLLIELHTGKTHQIRAQLAYQDFPIVGDSKYSKNSKKLPLFLHAVGLYITNDMQYLLMPSHWSGSFALRTRFPMQAKDIADLLY